MAHLFFGDDSFTIQETILSMKVEVGTADMRDVNTVVLKGEQINIDQLIATCDTIPFLAEKRLVVVHGLASLFEKRGFSQAGSGHDRQRSSSIDEWVQLASYLPKLPESTELVFIDGRLSTTNPLLKVLRPHVNVRTFFVPKGAELRKWILARATANGVDIEFKAVELLAEYTAGDTRIITTELEKLSLYRPDDTICVQDVLELVSYAGETNIFVAVDAIMEGRPAVALTSVHNLLQLGRPPSYVFSMIARQVRLLIMAKELRMQGIQSAEQGKRLGLTGYPLRKTQELERKFDKLRLARIHRVLLEADINIKFAAIDEEIILDTLVAELCFSQSNGTKVADRGL